MTGTITSEPFAIHLLHYNILRAFHCSLHIVSVSTSTFIATMSFSRCRFAIITFMVVLSSIAALAVGGYTDDRDVCGDPLPSAAMRAKPLAVVDWVRQQQRVQEINKDIDQHPFLQDLENGKLTKDVMQRFVINLAYNQERCHRCMHGAIDRWGQAYPVLDQRILLEIVADMDRDALLDLQKLAARFDINNIEELLRNEPDPMALQLPNAVCEAVQHIDDPNEIVVPLIAIANHRREVDQRIRKGLMNQAYKAWNLKEDDLRFFDRFNRLDGERVDQLAANVIQRGLDRQLTLCQVRRRAEAFQHGRRAVYDATMGRGGGGRPAVEVGF